VKSVPIDMPENDDQPDGEAAGRGRRRWRAAAGTSAQPPWLRWSSGSAAGRTWAAPLDGAATVEAVGDLQLIGERHHEDAVLG